MPIYSFTVSKRSDYGEVLKFLKENKEIEPRSTIRFNFDRKSFLSPFDILLFVQLVFYIRKNIGNGQSSLIFLSSPNKGTMDYITRIGLQQFCKSNYKQPTTIDQIESDTAMPIRRIDSDHLTEYVIKTIRYLKGFAESKDLTFLSLGIEESINNANDHSGSNIGAYVFCQYYPSLRKVSVCVSDFGVGITKKVHDYLNDDSFTDIECLSWALKELNSTKSTPQNSGKGLPNILNFVLSNKSSFRITTNDVMYQYVAKAPNKQHFSPNSIKNFIGTTIEFDILIDNLPDDDQDYVNDELF